MYSTLCLSLSFRNVFIYLSIIILEYTNVSYCNLRNLSQISRYPRGLLDKCFHIPISSSGINTLVYFVVFWLLAFAFYHITSIYINVNGVSKLPREREREREKKKRPYTICELLKTIIMNTVSNILVPRDKIYHTYE